MTNTKLFKNSAFSIFKNARFIFNTEPEKQGPGPEQIEKSIDIETTGHRLQKKFTEAVTKFKAHMEDTERKAGTLTLKESIQAYKKARDILGPVAREIYAFQQKHPEQKVLLVDTRGEKLEGITTVEKGVEMTTIEWAKAIGVEKSADTLWQKINEKAQAFLKLGTSAVKGFESGDAKIFEDQIASAKDYSDLDTSSHAFQAAEKTFAEFRQSARELQLLFGKTSPLGLNFGELISQIDELQSGTLANLNEKYRAGYDKILAKKSGPEKPEDVYRWEMAKAKKAAEEEAENLKPEAETAQPEHGWDAATGKFNLTAREFQRDTLGKHFDDFALKVNNRVAARAFPEDVAKNKNLKVGEYYYVEGSGKMTSKRALLTKDTVVSKDVPSDFVTQILAKNSRGTKGIEVVDPGEPK